MKCGNGSPKNTLTLKDFLDYNYFFSFRFDGDYLWTIENKCVKYGVEIPRHFIWKIVFKPGENHDGSATICSYVRQFWRVQNIYMRNIFHKRKINKNNKNSRSTSIGLEIYAMGKWDLWVLSGISCFSFLICYYRFLHVHILLTARLLNSFPFVTASGKHNMPKI
jgi:hypothetical protein